VRTLRLPPTAPATQGRPASDARRVTGVVIVTYRGVATPSSNPPNPDAIEEFARAGADIIRLWPPWISSDRVEDEQAVLSPLVERLHELGELAWTTADVRYRDVVPEHPREDLSELVRLGVDGRT
jgi:hypothetical protein